MEKKTTIKVENYGDMLAQINDLELVSFETDNGYQGEYLAVCKDKAKLYYFNDYYGSCSGCDWLEDKGDYSNGGYEVDYKEALEYCGGIKPKFIVPLNKPLEVKNLGEYSGFEIK